MHGHFEKKKPKKKGAKITLIVLAVILALVLAVFGGVYIYYTSMLNKINRAQLIEKDPSQELLDQIGGIVPDTEPEETQETTEETEPTETTVPETKPMTADDIINILVVGQAARPGEEARMADSTILVTINKYTKTVTLNSVLRDTFVKYPAYRGGSGGRCKFTVAYANAYAKWDTLGAMEVMNLLMEQNFGAEVDYNFEVDFELFIKFVDAMYGVELELTEAETDYLNKQLVKCGYPEMEPGYNSLDGFGALNFARMRKANGDGDSDIKRTARQRYLVDRIINKLGWMLQNKGISTVQNLANSMLPYLTTNMENSEITKLMLDLIPMLPELKVESGTIPVDTTYWGEMFDIYGIGRDESILRFDEGQNKKLIRAITEGEVAQ